MPLGTLPHRDEVQQVDAFVSCSVFDAFLTRQLDAPRLEERTVVGRVLHFYQAGVKVDLAGQRGYRNQGCAADRQNRRYRLVEEAFVAVGRLFQDEHVACVQPRVSVEAQAC